MGRPANDPICAFPRPIYDLVETFASPDEAAEIYRAVLRYYFEGVEVAPEEIGDERTACLVRSFLGRVVCARRSALAKSESGKTSRDERGDGQPEAAAGKHGDLGAEKPVVGSHGFDSCREVRTEIERIGRLHARHELGVARVVRSRLSLSWDVTCVKISDTRAREIRRPWGALRAWAPCVRRTLP